MAMMVAAGPSPAAVSLIVGMGISTWVAILTTVGYFARRFLTQQQNNHGDTLKALNVLEDVKAELPRLGWRLTRLEAAVVAGAAWLAYAGLRRR